MFIPSRLLLAIDLIVERRTREGGVTHPPQGHNALRQWMECLKQALHSHSHQLSSSCLQAAVAHMGQRQADRKDSR